MLCELITKNANLVNQPLLVKIVAELLLPPAQGWYTFK